MSKPRFVILKEDHRNFVPIGHVARPLTIDEARAEIVSLAKRYSGSTFHLFAHCGAAVHRNTIAMDLTAPDLSTAVVPLRNVGAGSA